MRKYLTALFLLAAVSAAEANLYLVTNSISATTNAVVTYDYDKDRAARMTIFATYASQPLPLNQAGTYTVRWDWRHVTDDVLVGTFGGYVANGAAGKVVVTAALDRVDTGTYKTEAWVLLNGSPVHRVAWDFANVTNAPPESPDVISVTVSNPVPMSELTAVGSPSGRVAVTQGDGTVAIQPISVSGDGQGVASVNGDTNSSVVISVANTTGPVGTAVFSGTELQIGTGVFHYVFNGGTNISVVVETNGNLRTIRIDSTASGGGFTLWTESTGTTQVGVFMSSTNAVGLFVGANKSISIQKPDGTTAGGDARGSGAVDLQVLRSAASEVAAGNNSFIGPGMWQKVAMGSSNSFSIGSIDTSIEGGSGANAAGVLNSINASISGVGGKTEASTIIASGRGTGGANIFGSVNGFLMGTDNSKVLAGSFFAGNIASFDADQSGIAALTAASYYSDNTGTRAFIFAGDDTDNDGDDSAVGGNDIVNQHNGVFFWRRDGNSSTLYSAADNTMVFFTTGLGINTNNPTHALDVAGGINAQDSFYYRQVAGITSNVVPSAITNIIIAGGIITGVQY